MAYATDTAASADELLTAIRSFATGSCGFTENGYTTDGTGHRLHLAHSGVGQYVNLRSQSASIALRASDGYSSGSAWDAQPNQSPLTYSWSLPGAVEYHLFGGEGYVHCLMLPAAASIWWHLGFGALEKAGAWTGGAFVGGFPASGVSRFDFRCDIDAQTNRWVTTNGSDGPFWVNVSTVPFNAVKPQFPVVVRSARLDGNGGTADMGWLPGMSLIHMTGLAQRDELTRGAETWKVFGPASGVLMNASAFLK